MSLFKIKITKGALRKYFSKPRAGEHRFYKNQFNRYIRRKYKRRNFDEVPDLSKECRWWEH